MVALSERQWAVSMEQSLAAPMEFVLAKTMAD
jgi:hypothetical protein